MIIESQKLKTILELLLHLDLDFDSLNLEISKPNENSVIIAVNYGDLYYISCVFDISNEANYDNFDIKHLVIPKNGVKKLYQLTTLWPKSSVNISNVNGLVSLEVVSHGQLVRERPVYIECLFQQAVNDYIIEAPSMKYNCSVNSKNLKQMLEFCTEVSEGVILEIREDNLAISSSNSSLATLVKLEELVEPPSKKIKLSTEANSLIISFLNKLVCRFNLVYLIFLEHETAFSIKANLDEFTVVQIYTIHD